MKFGLFGSFIDFGKIPQDRSFSEVLEEIEYEGIEYDEIEYGEEFGSTLGRYFRSRALQSSSSTDSW